MANKIIIKKSSVAGKVPLSTDLEIGELAVNLADAKLYSKNASGTVITVGGGGGGGGGDVTGPASATDNAITRFDGATGKLIQNSTTTIDDSGNAAGINAITFDTTPTTPPTAEGTLYWDSADGNQTLSLVMAGGNATQQIGEEQYYRIKASAPITDGQVVMFTGTVGASGALRGAPATGLTASTASYVMGVATQDMATNDWGYVTAFGLVRNINTSAFTDGAILYYDPSVAGGLTATIPSAPNAKVQVCACIHAASNGSLFVRPSFGGILGQYEGDVNIDSPLDGQLLIRDQTSGKWVNANLTAGTGIGITNAAGSVTVSNTGFVPSANGNLLVGTSTDYTTTATAGAEAVAGSGIYPYPTFDGATTNSSVYSANVNVPVNSGKASVATTVNASVNSQTTIGNKTIYETYNAPVLSSWIANSRPRVYGTYNKLWRGSANDFGTLANLYGAYNEVQITNTLPAAATTSVIAGTLNAVSSAMPVTTVMGTTTTSSLTSSVGALTGNNVNISYSNASGTTTTTSQVYGGFYNNFINNSTTSNSTITAVSAVRGANGFQNSSSGTLSAGAICGIDIGLASVIGANSSGDLTVTDCYGIKYTGLAVTGNNSVTTITNSYDLYLGTTTLSGVGAITNRWGVYQAEALNKNYFAGQLTANNIIESTSGGFKFPDGSTQTTAASGGAGFPSGTRMIFAQTAAPTGWTKDTVNYNNHALRVVTGAASTGGTVDFTTAFTAQTPSGSVSSSGSAGSTTATGSISVSGGSVAATTLATTQIPGHTHTYTDTKNSSNGVFQTAGGTGMDKATAPSGTSSSTGGGTSHTHTFTNPTASFTGTAHSHSISVSSSFSGNSIDLSVKYLDVITATKD